MEDYDFDRYEDIFRMMGYNYSTNKNENSENQYTNDKTTFDGNAQRNINDLLGCGDILGGFQEMYPELFVVIGEIIGNAIAGKLPLNVQNSFGNWLQLIGQVILTYNAQQQYYQGGPGRYFTPENYNVSNPFCPITNMESSNKSSVSNKKKKNKSRKELNNEINNLKNSVNELKNEIEKLKRQSKNVNC